MLKLMPVVRVFVLFIASLVLYGCISNDAPSSDAGDDQTVDGFSDVKLDGGSSLDPNGDALRYEWKLVKKPIDSDVALDQTTSASPVFVPDVPGDYEFSLVVSDGSARSGTDHVVIHVTGLKADAGHDHFAGLGESVTLDGSHSRAMDGDTFGYTWSFVTRPRKSVAQLSGDTTATPSFTADVAGRYVSQLVISIEKRKSQAALVRVRTSGIVADAGQNVVTAVGVAAALDGSKSKADSAGVLSFSWDVLQRPSKSVAAVVDAKKANASFTPDIAGRYLLRLTVTKGSEMSTAQVVISTAAVPVTGGTNPHGGHVKPPTHILSTDACLSCHTSSNWVPVLAVDHTQVKGPCADCHNGVVTVGKTAHHILATNRCEACHSTSSFTPFVTVDHTEVMGSCAACHNGIIARGKPLSHIASSDACENCHLTTAFKPVLLVSHDQLTGSCISCHDGVIVMGKSPKHVATTDSCEACHATTTFAPAIIVDHNQVVGTCESCHNGTQARGKPVTHIATTVSCERCHTLTAWLPASKTPKP